MKILLVDDEAIILRLHLHLLKRLGHEDITTHQDPAAAVEALETGALVPDLILLDLQMPGIDGIEFVRHLVRLQYGGALILVSGEDERILHTARRLAEAQKLRVLGALHKPIAPPALAALIENYTPGADPAAAAAAAPAARKPRKVYSAERVAEGIANGEFVNAYQPKVRVSDGVLSGVETLVRWRHPEDGLVFPDSFITVTEEHGLINDLTRVVLERALDQGDAWRQQGIDIPVAVNISMDSLSSLEFPTYLFKLVETRKVQPKQLVVEVTESRLMSNPLIALDVCSRLRLKHIGLSIDDFGTGHSSLQQLQDIPFDELKVDRQFINRARKDPVSRAILETSLSMGRQLGMKTVVEGIEEVEEWALLEQLGCDVVQGYLVAKPMFPEALPAWMAEWNERRKTFITGAR